MRRLAELPPFAPPQRATVTGVAAMLLAAIACGREKPGVATPSAPLTVESAPAMTTTKREISRFSVPLLYDFSPMLDVVNRAVPTRFGSLDSIRTSSTDDRKRYAFEATRGPFSAEMRDGAVHLTAILSYAARGYYKIPIGPRVSAGCGLDGDRPRLVVELVSPLTLTPTWHLRSRVALARVAPATDSGHDRCRISAISYDVTDHVVAAAERALRGKLPEIDRRVARISLTRQATGWWGSLNAPIRLAPEVWLVLAPVQLRMGDVRGRGRMLTIQATLDALPRVITGPRPQANVTPLPSLARDTAGTGFDIAMEGLVDYATISRVVSHTVAGKLIRGSGQSVRLDSVTASSAPGGRVQLAVAFHGDATGALQLVGRPRLSTALDRIVVPDLDYELATDNPLIEAFAWLRADELLSILRAGAAIPVAPALARGRELLLGGLNRTIGRSLTLRASVDSVHATSLEATAAGVVVRAEAMGNALAAVVPKRK